MEIDYRNMAQIIDLRLMQIQDASKTHEYFNNEYNELKNIRDSVSNMLIQGRKKWTDYEVYDTVPDPVKVED